MNITQNLGSSLIQSSNTSLNKSTTYSYGVHGRYAWVLRIFTPLLFIGLLAFEDFWSGQKNRQSSDKFHLWVTPPGYFFLIWPVIYAGVLISNFWNLYSNAWTQKVHFFFCLSNTLSIFWTFVFDHGSQFSTFFSSMILLFLTLSIWVLWTALGQIPQNKVNNWTIFVRNVFAFYLGWTIAATNINLGMDIVYWWGASKQTQMIIFWISAFSLAVTIFIVNAALYGKFGVKCCIAIWISVIWAFTGAGISSYNCIKGLQQLC